jgi:hypothetical protein
LKLKAIFFCLVYFWFSIANCNAISLSGDSSKKRINLIVKADLILPIYSLLAKAKLFSITVEKLLGSRHSFQLSYLSYSSQTDVTEPNYHEPIKSYQNRATNTFIVIPEYKFFVSRKKRHSGYYAGFFLSYSSRVDEFHNKTVVPAGYGIWNVLGPATIYGPDYNQREQDIGGGIINGIQFYVFKKVVVDFLLGLGARKPIKSEGPIYTEYVLKGQIRGAINIGYKF